MSRIERFSARQSGRDMTRRRPAAPVKVERPAPEPKKNPEPKAAPRKPEANDGKVKVSDG